MDEIPGSSQFKSMDIIRDDRSARKRLIRDDGTINVRGQPVPNLAGKVAGIVLLIEKGEVAENSVRLEPSTNPGEIPIVNQRK